MSTVVSESPASAVGGTSAHLDSAPLREILGGMDPTGGSLPAGPFEPLARAAIADEPPDPDRARGLLRVTGTDLAHLLGAALMVRERYFGRRVKLCVLENARSGLCPEDCGYCSQSVVSSADISKYRLRPTESLRDAARRAESAGARRFCMVVSGRGPSEADVDRFVDAAHSIRAESDIELCVSAGLMTLEQAQRLQAAGVGWVNHNLNTSRRFYPEVCTTHSYDDRMETLRNVRQAGLKTCSGVILGMGETDDDLVEVAGALREMRVESLPVNFLHPIDGTPLERREELPVERALAGLCVFRLFNPACDLRAAGGRERKLGPVQPLALFAANSIFAEGYLTTPGQAAASARTMIEAMGFTVEE